MTLDEARDHIGHGVVYLPSGGAAEDGVIASVTASTVFVRFSGDLHAKSCRPEDLTLTAGLASAVLHFTRTWRELMTMLPDSYGCSMNCPEANAAEELWLAAGDLSGAKSIAAAHAAHDEECDEHWEAGQAEIDRLMEADQARLAQWRAAGTSRPGEVSR
jgi:hypothetical protein